MVLLLNYLPWIIAVLGIIAIYKSYKIENSTKRKKAVVISALTTITLMVVLQGLTAGYIPKKRSSEVKIPAPSFEPAQAVIQDNLRAPRLEVIDSEARFNELTDWKQHKRDEEAKDKGESAPVAQPSKDDDTEKYEMVDAPQ